MSTFLRKRWIYLLLVEAPVVFCPSSSPDLNDENVKTIQNLKDKGQIFGLLKNKMNIDGSIWIEYDLNALKPYGQLLQFQTTPGIADIIPFKYYNDPLPPLDLSENSKTQKNSKLRKVSKHLTSSHQKTPLDDCAYFYLSDKYHYLEAFFTGHCLNSLKKQTGPNRSLSSLEGSLLSLTKSKLLIKIQPSYMQAIQDILQSHEKICESNTNIKSLLQSSFFLQASQLQLLLIIREVRWIGSDGCPICGSPKSPTSEYAIMAHMKEVFDRGILAFNKNWTNSKSSDPIEESKSIPTFDLSKLSSLGQKRKYSSKDSTDAGHEDLNNKFSQKSISPSCQRSTQLTISKDSNNINPTPSGSLEGKSSSRFNDITAGKDNLPFSEENYDYRKSLDNKCSLSQYSPEILVSETTGTDSFLLEMNSFSYSNSQRHLELFQYGLEAFSIKKNSSINSSKSNLMTCKFSIHDSDIWIDCPQQSELQNLLGWKNRDGDTSSFSSLLVTNPSPSLSACNEVSQNLVRGNPDNKIPDNGNSLNIPEGSTKPLLGSSLFILRESSPFNSIYQSVATFVSDSQPLSGILCQQLSVDLEFPQDLSNDGQSTPFLISFVTTRYLKLSLGKFLQLFSADEALCPSIAECILSEESTKISSRSHSTDSFLMGVEIYNPLRITHLKDDQEGPVFDNVGDKNSVPSHSHHFNFLENSPFASLQPDDNKNNNESFPIASRSHCPRPAVKKKSSFESFIPRSPFVYQVDSW